MPRARKPENKGLPAGWRLQHGAYYYQVPSSLSPLWDGKSLFRLGKTLVEAYQTWAARLGGVPASDKVGYLLDRYAREAIPSKAKKTQIDNIKQIARLRAVFGDMRFSDIKPMHIYRYTAERTAKVAARREMALFSHVFTKAVEWGCIDRHPFKGEVRLESEAPRTRYVEDWEIDEVMKLKPVWKGDATRQMQCFVKIRRITGMRVNDLLSVRLSDADDEGIKVTPRKTEKRTGKTTIYQWTDELRALWEEALALRQVDISPWLFCTRRGQSYYNADKGTSSGWNSMWRRFMDRALEETKLKERFTATDIRAKAASDATGLDHAQSLLTHASSSTTKRVYRRKPERVKPLR